MAVLTSEEIKALKDSGNEALAAIALKLESSNYVPQDRFNEKNAEAKAAQDALAKIKADAEAVEAERMAKQGEYKALADKAQAELEKIKPFADQFNAIRTRKIEELKKSLGDDFLPEYESFSLESLEKVGGKKSAPPPTDSTPPGSVPPKEYYTREEIAKMSQAEVGANLEKVNKSLAHFKK